MRQRRRSIFRSRRAMHEGGWTKCGFARVAAVDKPGAALAQRQRISSAQFHEQIMRMLPINDELTFVRFAGLKQERRATWRKCERLETEHAAQFQRSLPHPTQCRKHEPDHRFGIGHAVYTILSLFSGNRILVKRDNTVVGV